LRIASVLTVLLRSGRGDDVFWAILMQSVCGKAIVTVPSVLYRMCVASSPLQQHPDFFNFSQTNRRSGGSSFERQLDKFRTEHQAWLSSEANDADIRIFDFDALCTPGQT
jgi:hypothetical protein